MRVKSTSLLILVIKPAFSTRYLCGKYKVETWSGIGFDNVVIANQDISFKMCNQGNKKDKSYTSMES